ncbi:hypothetical protein F7725_020253, partial [Dissostichus mawsoni]
MERYFHYGRLVQNRTRGNKKKNEKKGDRLHPFISFYLFLIPSSARTFASGKAERPTSKGSQEGAGVASLPTQYLRRSQGAICARLPQISERNVVQPCCDVRDSAWSLDPEGRGCTRTLNIMEEWRVKTLGGRGRI